MTMRFVALLLAMSLTACGVADVGTTAATQAKLQTDQAKQGQQLEERINSQVSAATATAEQQAKAAESQ